MYIYGGKSCKTKRNKKQLGISNGELLYIIYILCVYILRILIIFFSSLQLICLYVAFTPSVMDHRATLDSAWCNAYRNQ